MGRSKETFGKKEVKNKKMKKRKEKALRKQEKREKDKSSFDDMLAYVDQNGQICSEPPPAEEKQKIKAENIEIGTPKAKFRINNKLRTGRLKNFDDDKGYGFIIDSESKESIFVHANDCKDPLKVGIRVEFETEKGLKGVKAINVKPI